MPSKPGHRALRIGRVSLPRQAYLLTAVTRHRKALFLDPQLASTASQCMIRRESLGDADLLCWVLMPDHWHGLVQLGDGDGLSRVMNRMKTSVSRQLQTQHGRGDVWAPGFHDRALRSEEDLRAIARYIVANPVRAGLVGHVCDYPYWNCVWL